MFPLLFAPISPLFAGFCSEMRVAHYYKRCKKSLVFALKSCKIRIENEAVFDEKTMKNPRFFEISPAFSRNIMYCKILTAAKPQRTVAVFGVGEWCKSLGCKILTPSCKEMEKKVQKSRCFFTRFSR